MLFVSLTVFFLALLFDKLNIFLYLIISAFLHEAGHIIACILCKKIPKIKISPFGISLSNYPDEKYRKLFVLISGPAINLFCAIYSYYSLKEQFHLNVYVFFCLNLIVFIFNILPIHFLDGGQILQLFLKNSVVCKITELISMIFIVVTLVYFSHNIIISASAVILFYIYYFLIKNDLL